MDINDCVQLKKKKDWPLDRLKDRGRLDCLEKECIKSDWTSKVIGIE